MIDFNVPPVTGNEIRYMQDAISRNKICGDGYYTKMCNAWIQQNTGAKKALLTTSCTHSLELAALLCEIKYGDEVILPSYTFVSTATAFVLRGAKIVFVDIRPDTMNIDETKIENAITDKTVAIVPVHYAGVSCEMETIMKIANKYKIKVVEDAAQGVLSTYKGHALGTIGDYGCYSFHETKNYSMGEGGAILISDNKSADMAEIMREKGTDRSKFIRGQIDKYTWVSQGSSYLPSELNAAYLYAQLEMADVIFEDRMKSWDMYNNAFVDLKKRGCIEVPYIPTECEHNAHMYYIKLDNLEERTKFIEYMKKNGVLCVFHYIPLHSAPAGKKYGVFSGEDVYTTRESERIVRLPLYYNMGDATEKVIELVKKYFNA